MRIAHIQLLVLILALPCLLLAQKKRNIKISEFPENELAFRKLQRNIARSPEGAGVMLLVALKKYAEDPKMGYQWVALASTSNQLSLNRKSEKLKLKSQYIDRISIQLEHFPFLPQSYIAGTQASELYKLPSAPYKFYFHIDKYAGSKKSGKLKLRIASSGDSNKRYFTVAKDPEGIWKVEELGTLIESIYMHTTLGVRTVNMK